MSSQYRIYSGDYSTQDDVAPPVNPMMTPSKAHVMTLPPFTPPTDDRLHSNPITLTTTAQPTSTHSSEPHPLTVSSTSASNSLSTTQQGLPTFSNKYWTNELARAKEKAQEINQPVSEGFATGWVGGASNKGKMKEKKFSMHESGRSSKEDDEQIVCSISAVVKFSKNVMTFYRIHWKCQKQYLYSCHQVASCHLFHLLLASCRRR